MKRAFLALIGGLLLALASPVAAAQPASLYFSGAQSSYLYGQHVSLDVMVNPNGATYDTVNIDVSFPADILQVQRIAINPVFSVVSPDNTFSNASGVISYGAGVPAGTTSAMKFATITFDIKKVGTALVALSGSQSLVLNSGENIFNGGPSTASFTITALPVEQPVQKPVVVPKKTTPPVATTPAPTSTTPEQPVPQQETVNPDQNIAAAASVPIVEPNSKTGVLGQLAGWWWLIALVAILFLLIFGWRRKKQQDNASQS